MQADEKNTRFLSEREAAKYIGISPRTLWGWRSVRKVPFYHLYGKTVRYKKEDLDSFLEKFRVESAELLG